MGIGTFILQSMYFMLPAYVANMAPVLFRKRLKFLAIPINKKIFGKNKTYRGFIFGVPLAILTAYLQFAFPNSLVYFDYSKWFVIGLSLGFGALLGDLIESYFKRKSGVKPGESWKLFDQLDFVLGSLVAASLFLVITSKMILTIIVSSLVVTILANHLAYTLGIRKVKW